MDGRRYHSLVKLGWKLPYLRLLSSRNTVILLYHGIPRENDGDSINSIVFEKQIVFLKRYFKIIPPDKLWEKREPRENIRVAITFDDGFGNNAQVVAPILRKHAVPAMFFVCSRHSIKGKYLWFSYLRALKRYFPGEGFIFRGEFIDMSARRRDTNVSRLSAVLLDLKPHPFAMYKAMEEELPVLEDFVNPEKLADSYAGMTSQQIKVLANDSLFSFGVHTVDHPFLTRCKPAEIYRQISENRTWIEKLTNRRCDSIAYPSGVYDTKVLELCRSVGLAQGFSVIPILKTEVKYELPRMGIYSGSLDVLGCKVQWGNLLRTLSVKVG